MGKKIMNTVLFLAVLGGCIAMTLLTGSKHDGLQLRISCHYGSDLSGGIIRRGVPSGWYYTGIFKRDARTYQCF